MIGLFNIPSESPIEFHQSPQQQFNFAMAEQTSMQSLIDKFSGNDERQQEIGTRKKSHHTSKYLVDGRKLSAEGKPIEVGGKPI